MEICGENGHLVGDCAHVLNRWENNFYRLFSDYTGTFDDQLYVNVCAIKRRLKQKSWRKNSELMRSLMSEVYQRSKE